MAVWNRDTGPPPHSQEEGLGVWDKEHRDQQDLGVTLQLCPMLPSKETLSIHATSLPEPLHWSELSAATEPQEASKEKKASWSHFPSLLGTVSRPKWTPEIQRNSWCFNSSQCSLTSSLHLASLQFIITNKLDMIPTSSAYLFIHSFIQ